MTPRLDFRYPKERVLLDSATVRLRRLLENNGPDHASFRIIAANPVSALGQAIVEIAKAVVLASR
jgi:hypothetical protein